MGRRTLRLGWYGVAVTAGALLAAGGCYNTPISTSEFARGPVPLREPSPGRVAEAGCCYEDSLTGGKIFAMYCGACHNARSLAERPFSNYQNAAAHMRVRAKMTGKEYAKLMEWLRRWHDVPPPNPPVEPSPTVVTFSQPVQELRPEAQKGAEANGRPGNAPAGQQ
jgi:hypothetical protein